MTTQNRPTITTSRSREEIGTTMRGTGNAVALLGTFMVASSFIFPEPPMGGGLTTGLNFLGGFAFAAVGTAARWAGGRTMDLQRPQPPTNG